MKDIYFNSKKLNKGTNEYVAFIDIMGTKAHMEHSIEETATFVFKLHAAIISAWRREKYTRVFVYPVMDGAYITASNKEDMEKMLARIFTSLSKMFIDEGEFFDKFVIQAGVAYGKMYHGHDVPYSASKVFELDLSYKNNILIGQPMVDAYIAADKASPFGVKLATSAIKLPNKKNTGAFDAEWKWYKDTIADAGKIYGELSSKLYYYFEAFRDLENPLHYKEDRIDTHLQRIVRYFGMSVSAKD